jgi:hypothetical protein
VQVLDALMENIAHAQTQVKELIEKFYILTWEIEEVHKV